MRAQVPKSEGGGCDEETQRDSRSLIAASDSFAESLKVGDFRVRVLA